jgi:hypothetical protein
VGNRPPRRSRPRPSEQEPGSATADNADFSVEAERRSVEAGYRYEYELGGYAAIQGTRPQSIAYGLTDSPALQLPWIADGFKEWTDSETVPEDTVDRDALLTNVMLCWPTGTPGRRPATTRKAPTPGGAGAASPVPTAVAMFPHDIAVPIPATRRTQPQHRPVDRVRPRWQLRRDGGTGPDDRPAGVVPELPLIVVF